MKSQSGRAMTGKDLAPDSEGMLKRSNQSLVNREDHNTNTNDIELKFRQKCKDLKRRINEVEESNELATLAISRTKTSIRRLRLEHSILLERLEQNAIQFPENFEDMSPPPSPILDSQDKLKPTGNKRSKKDKESKFSETKQKIRDPDLPKRPTNAYLIFCELEKERIKQTSGDQSLSSIPELGKSLVEAWKNLDDEGRKPYHKIYEEDKERYQREMAAYNQRKQDQGNYGAAEEEEDGDGDGDAEADNDGEEEDEEADGDEEVDGEGDQVTKTEGTNEPHETSEVIADVGDPSDEENNNDMEVDKTEANDLMIDKHEDSMRDDTQVKTEDNPQPEINN